MKLFLTLLLVQVVIGLVTDRFDRWTYLYVVTSAVVTTGLFYTMQRFWL